MMRYNRQLHAGFILEPVWKIIPDSFIRLQTKNLLHYLSTFEIETNVYFNKPNDSIVSVINNIISRGLPTLPSLFIEKIFSEIFGISEKHEDTLTGEISYNPTKKLKEIQDLILRSFFVIEPRLKKVISSDNNNTYFKFDSEYEKEFFVYHLPKIFGKHINQLIEPQREIKNILNSSDEIWVQNIKNNSYYSNLFRQRVDFALEFPKTNDLERGIIFEIDGPSHKDDRQKYLDKQRDNTFNKLNWRVKRFSIKDNNLIEKLNSKEIKRLVEHPYLKILSNNFDKPIWEENNGLDALQIALSPFAIARLQKTILYLFQTGTLHLNKQELKLAIIERDVPCGFLAIKDLIEFFENLFLLEGKKRKFPKIKWKIFTTDEFKNAKLNNGIQKSFLNDFDSREYFDAILDISMLQRFGYDFPELKIPYSSKNYIKIRSVKSIKEPRLVQSAEPIKYQIPDSEQPKPLVFFLRNIFRKIQFREGQVPILKRTLTLQNVIALLPTGAGKSLTYQLSALLQPGIVLVVDPLKSLMRDQNDNLKMIGIDSTVFINSSIKNPILRNLLSERMTKGYYHFVFISPERLQIEEFRKYLSNMHNTYFTYCIVDEAHCVSEWGHDFRTAYLQLGKNAKKFCKTLVKTKNLKGEIVNQVPIIGLTGTASFEVLADVQRELDFSENDEAAIIAPSKYERKELHFIIKKLDDLEININHYNEWEIKKIIANEKYNELFYILDEIPHKFEETSIYNFLSRDKIYKNCGIVFCPHVGGYFGVLNVADVLKEKYPFLKEIIDVYAGKLSDDEDSGINLEDNQRKFKNDEIGLLVATKAFGMGIDKPNIRFTIHLNMPQSLEAFYQEAGRAGRDRQNAYCYLIYSPTKIPGQTETVDKQLMISFHNAAFRGKEKEKRILWELLNEITYPDNKNIDSLNNLFYQEIEIFEKFNELNIFNYNPYLRVWFGQYPSRARGGDVHKRLYLNIQPFPKTIGYIDLDTEERIIEDKIEKVFLKPTEAESILEELYYWLKQKQPKHLTFLKWISYQKKVENSPGIEKLLEYSSSGQITIGFTNKPFQILEDLLSKHDLAWDIEMLENAYQFSYSFKEFIRALKREYKKKTNKDFYIDEKIETFIKNNFIRLRTRTDTFKAIYRLNLIGIIDEYTVDYNSRTITAFFSKKDEETYIKNLQKYIGKYVPANDREKIPEEILSSRGNTVIQKCCGYLVEFVYDRIVNRRKEAIKMMEEAIKSDDFSERVYSYFDSKYIPDFRKENILYNYDINNVWKFINKTKGEPNNLSHLRGACDRFLVENPDNPTLLILRSFCYFLIPSDSKSEAINDFKKGIEIFNKRQNWNRKTKLFIISKFIAEILKFDSKIGKYLSLLIFDEHLNWLKEFNKNFMRGIKHD